MLSSSELRTPFKKIIFSPCVIAACSSSYTYSFIMSSTLAYLPVFNYQILGLGPLSNSVASTLPFLAHACVISALYASVMFLKNRGISATTTVKAFSCIGTSGLSLCLIVLLITNISQAVLLTLVQSIGLGLLSFISLSCTLCATTVAPQFTIFVFSYMEVYAQLAGIFSPVVMQMLSIKVSVQH
ncbi:hypothetical protein OESDEN_03220 [Oesophagostomum dentatum]|uniref:Major facilitator superfamily (MFS) profile domain-containing protein n=1 Tax=Oesophagostomum dentatum TaxID=61180 RepID=A0A0B1TN33_OESDE|nr:hypothetical protein OESDEN_03220 [Oesophagostomum dentatum]